MRGKLIIEQGATPTPRELRAAQLVAGLDRGHTVVLRRPIGRRSPAGGTADLLIDGGAYDVYTPTTSSGDRIVGAIAGKGDRAFGVVVDLSDTSVSAADLGDVLTRVRGTGSRLQDVIPVGGCASRTGG